VAEEFIRHGSLINRLDGKGVWKKMYKGTTKLTVIEPSTTPTPFNPAIR
jgi:hypothetical protein